MESINEVKHLPEIMGSDHAPISLDIDVWFTETELTGGIEQNKLVEILATRWEIHAKFVSDLIRKG